MNVALLLGLREYSVFYCHICAVCVFKDKMNKFYDYKWQGISSLDGMAELGNEVVCAQPCIRDTC